MPSVSNLAKVWQSIKRLTKDPREAEEAIERSRSLPEHVDPSVYSPGALARASLMRPAAQRGFSESLTSTRPPFATAKIRPSEFLDRTPPLDSARDANIVAYLKSVLPEEKLREIPQLGVEQYPKHLDAGYEGRHRMRALQELYGDDPVLLNLIKGDRFDMVNSPYYSEPVRKYVGDIQASPLELLRQRIMFGDRSYEPEVIWRGER